MLDKPFPFATRRTKKDAPPLVDVDGKPLATQPEPRNWCRFALVVSLVPPPDGGIISFSTTSRTLRATIHAPRKVVTGLTLAALGSVPWVRELALWVFAHWK